MPLRMWSTRGVLLLLILTVGIIYAQYDCPQPWVEFEENCYYFQMYSDDLQNAKESCARDGASLVSVDYRAEHEFIVEWLRSNDIQHREWYTSGRRDVDNQNKYSWEGSGEQVQGLFFWLEGFTPKTWQQTPPDERIVYKSSDDDAFIWGWVLRNATLRKPYICEIPRGEVYKIVQETRGFGYGSASTDPQTWQRGPEFTDEPTTDLIYDKDGVNKYISFECRAEGNPLVSYDWYIEQGQLVNMVDPMVERRYSLTNGKLTINDPDDSKDNGKYYCIAKNKFGALKSHKAQLKFEYLLDFPRSNRDPVRVSEYDGKGIECNPPKQSPEILYAWYKDTIQNFVRPHLKRHMFISHNGKLYFSRVTKEDEGDYVCMIFSPRAHITAAEGKESMPIRLIVRRGVGNEREPQIASGFPTVFPSSPKKGDNVRLECFAFGTGLLQYHWQKVGGKLPYRHEIADHGRVLNIPNLDLENHGTYRCTVKREFGSATTGDLELSIDAAPYFTIPLQNQHVDEGADVTWRCYANGIPAVAYKWYVNATELDQSKLSESEKDRFQFSNNVLLIKNVQPRDGGMYQCGASNLYGEYYSSAQMRVLSMKPSFDKRPLQKVVYATRGGGVTLICDPEGAPEPEVKWLKDGRALSSSNEYKILANKNLHISGVKTGNQGTYTCEASNALGEDSSSGRLVVLSSTTISYPPNDDVIHVNKTGFLHCEASYNPVLDVTYHWFHNGREIEFVRYKFVGYRMYVERDPHFSRGTGINRGGLFINRAQYYHTGMYKCVAQTTTETVEKVAKITVIGPPGEPVGIVASDVTAKTARVSWKPGADHSNEITSYTVEGFNMYDKEWVVLKANIRGQEMKNKTAYVTDLKPWNQYYFRVRAENILGLGQPSNATTTLYRTRPAVPIKAPMNVGGGEGKVGTLTITWEPLGQADWNGPGVGYLVSWKKSHMEDEEFDEFEVEGGSKAIYVKTVGSKNFYRQYDVQVQVYNAQGLGPASPLVTIWSAEDLPVGMPITIRAYPHNATALLVEWDMVPNTRQYIKGVLLGYRVNYWKEATEDETMAIYRPIPGQVTGGLIIGLEPDTYYMVNVQVFNSAGNGPKSQEFIQETLRSAPMEAPQEVKLHIAGSDSVKLTWRGVSTGNEEEPLQGYKIRYYRLGENIYVAQDIDVDKNTDGYISGLKENTTYIVRVFGYSRGGDGLMSSPALQVVLGKSCFIKEDSPDKTYLYKCGSSYIQMSVILVTLTTLCHVLSPWL